MLATSSSSSKTASSSTATCKNGSHRKSAKNVKAKDCVEIDENLLSIAANPYKSRQLLMSKQAQIKMLNSKVCPIDQYFLKFSFRL